MSIVAYSSPATISYITFVECGLVPFSHEAVALKDIDLPSPRDVNLRGVNLTVSAGTPTVTVQVADLPLLLVAVIFAVPFATAVTTPFSSTVAQFSLEDFHTTDLSVASSGPTVTLRARVSPILIKADVLSKETLLTGIIGFSLISLISMLPGTANASTASPFDAAGTPVISYFPGTASGFIAKLSLRSAPSNSENSFSAAEINVISENSFFNTRLTNASSIAQPLKVRASLL